MGGRTVPRGTAAGFAVDRPSRVDADVEVGVAGGNDGAKYRSSPGRGGHSFHVEHGRGVTIPRFRDFLRIGLTIDPEAGKMAR